MSTNSRPKTCKLKPTEKALWSPSQERINHAHIVSLSKKLEIIENSESSGTQIVSAFHHWSTTHREDYWKLLVAEMGIRFSKPFDQVLKWDAERADAQWFLGARLNIAQSCFHPAHRSALALVEEREDGRKRQYSFGELEALCLRIAERLDTLGLKPGDAAAIDLPMTSEAVAIYLALVLKGCAVVSIADSFAPGEIETRLRIGRAKAIFTQDVLVRGAKGLPLYEKVIQARAPRAIVISAIEGKVQGPALRPEDVSWSEFLGENFLVTPLSKHAQTLSESGT